MIAGWVQVPLLRGRSRSARIYDVDDAVVNPTMFTDTTAPPVVSVDPAGFEVTVSCISLLIEHSNSSEPLGSLINRQKLVASKALG